MRAVDDGQQRIRGGLPALGGDLALRVDGAQGPLEHDLLAADLLRQAVPVGVALAIGEQHRRSQRVPMSALDQFDLGPQLGAKRRRDHQGWSRVTTIPRLSDLWEHHWGYRSSQPCDLLCRLIWSGARLAYTRPRAAASLQSRSVRLIERINVINKFSDIARPRVHPSQFDRASGEDPCCVDPCVNL